MLWIRIGVLLTLAALASCGGGGLFRFQPNLPEPQKVEAERLTIAHGDATGWTVEVPQPASSTWRHYCPTEFLIKAAWNLSV